MAAPTVVNGDFANPSVASESPNPTMPGWTWELGGAPKNEVRLRPPGTDGWPGQSIKIIANSEGSPGPPCSACQDLVFDGELVVLRFRFFRFLPCSTLRVSIGSTVLLDEPVSPPSHPKWGEMVFAATPAAGTQRLRITATQIWGCDVRVAQVRIDPPLPGRLVTPRNGASGLFSAI